VLLKTRANLIEDDVVQEDGKKGNEKVDISSTQDLLAPELDNNSIQYVSEHHCQDGKLNINLEIDSSLELEKNVIEKGNKQDEYQKQGRIELEEKQMTLLKAKKNGGFSYDEKEKQQLIQMENVHQKAKEKKTSCARKKTTSNKKRKKNKETTTKTNNKKKVSFDDIQPIPSVICCY